MRQSIIILAILAFGCGDDDSADVVPRILERGGVADAPIEGVLHVHVVDSEDGTPIGGATVYLGDASDPVEIGLTDGDGLLTYDGELLTNEGEASLVVSASAPQRASQSWYGVEGANVTIPLRRTSSAGETSAIIRGTIEGWEDLQAPPSEDHFLAALVDFSRPQDISRFDGMTQGRTGMVPDNACVKSSEAAPPCAFELRSRSGNLALIAPILDVDTQGTPDDSDNVAVVVAYAFLGDLQIEPGETREGVVLELIARDELSDVEADFPEGSAFNREAAVVAIDLGDDGLAITSALSEDVPVGRTPTLEGAFAGASYWVIRVGNAPTGMSIGISRDVTDLAPLTLPDLLPLPEYDVETEAISFNVPPRTTVVSVDLEDDEGQNVYTAFVLDDRVDVPRPATVLLEDDATRVSVNAVAAPLDVRDFALAEVVGTLTGLAAQRGEL